MQVHQLKRKLTHHLFVSYSGKQLVGMLSLADLATNDYANAATEETLECISQSTTGD